MGGADDATTARPTGPPASRRRRWAAVRRGGDRLFDRVVVVDWSANSTPKTGRDSIWLARHDADGTASSLNVSTRAQAVEVLFRLLTLDDARTLLAVDFSLGFPVGTADALGCARSSWAAVWALLSSSVADDASNRNNRFEVASELNRSASPGPGPFWGCPPSKATPTLTTTKAPTGGLSEWRVTEDALRSAGHRPFSCWQLLGAGAVGSQTLLGIPALRRLVARLEADGRATHVWPFTTGADRPTPPPGSAVVAEVWPSLIEVPADDRIRDEAQVETLAASLVALDRGGRLAALFEPELTPRERTVVEGEEGWVLGARTGLATDGPDTSGGR